jgi:4-amino-4-deoxy-L-arabinose transferase-like glycosyltransferase
VQNPDPLVFMPANMNEVRPGVFYQKYPIGFPLLVAIGYKVGGQLGAFLVNPIIGCLALLAAMALTSELAGAGWGILAGLVLAIHPLMVFYSTAALSHISNLACVLAGLWCLWRWQSRGGFTWAAGTGLFLGYAVSIRYTEALLGLVVIWIVAFRMRQAPLRRVGLELIAMIIAGLIALTPLMLFQWASYGSPLLNGYGLTRESTAFSWSAFREHVWPVVKTMGGPGFGIPAMVVVALGGLVDWLTALVRRSDRARSQLKLVGYLVVWIVPGLLLYISYYWSSPYPTLYMRLFLSAYAGIVVAAAVTLRAVSHNRTWLGKSLALGLIGVALLGRWISSADEVLENNWSVERLTQEGMDLARAAVPAGAVLITDDWMAYPAVFASDL